MAIVKFGPTVVGARGTIAGTIFTANKAGPYARGWSKGANPKSPLQSDQRTRFASLASAWRGLTTAQRDDWIDYADDPPQELTNSLGETYFASGFNWYVRINDHLEAAGAARRDDAPTLTRPLAPIISNLNIFITGAAGNLGVQYAVADPALGELHVVFARLYSSQGIVSGFNNLTFMIMAVPNVNRAVLFETEFENAFGTVSLGQRGFCTSTIQDAHGQRGPEDTEFADSKA